MSGVTEKKLRAEVERLRAFERDASRAIYRLTRHAEKIQRENARLLRVLRAHMEAETR